MNTYHINPEDEVVSVLEGIKHPNQMLDDNPVVQVLLSAYINSYCLVMPTTKGATPQECYQWCIPEWYPGWIFTGEGWLMPIPPEQPDLTLDEVYREITFI